jgi:hypothetical protein
MTLIAAHINEYGIVMASDSNVTSIRGVREARKVFEVPKFNAVLSVAGSFHVNEIPMDEWIPDFIVRRETWECRSLTEVAEYLRASLEGEMWREQKLKLGSFVHLAGYAPDENGFHPEFHFIRNVYKIDEVTGEYDDFRETFLATEEYRATEREHRALPPGYEVIESTYVNGFPEGRENYWRTQYQLRSFFHTIWRKANSQLHPPRSIRESVIFTKLYMTTLVGLFEMSNYSPCPIGGEIQVKAIAPPTP